MAKYRVLIPLDGSTFSSRVLPHICRLLSPKDYRVILLHVAPFPEDDSTPLRPLIVDGWTHIMQAGAWELEHEQARHPAYVSHVWDDVKTMLQDDMAVELRCLKEAGFEVSAVVRFGEPAQEIADLVEEEDVALVVMATHGRTGLSRMVMGSVAEKVLRSLRVPVMMVRALGDKHNELLPVSYLSEEGR